MVKGDTPRTPDCPGCGQGFLYELGHTGEGLYFYCFICQRGFTKPDEGHEPTTIDPGTGGATIDSPTHDQLAAVKEINPEHPLVQMHEGASSEPTTNEDPGGAASG